MDFEDLRREQAHADARANALSLLFPEVYFSDVWAFDIIEHTEDDNRLVEEAHRILRSAAVLWLSTPSLSPKAHSPSRRYTDIAMTTSLAILGAGFAGHGSVWLLRQTGNDSLVIERRPRAGGSVRGLTWYEFSCGFAAHGLLADDKTTTQLFINTFQGQASASRPHLS